MIVLPLRLGIYQVLKDLFQVLFQLANDFHCYDL